MMNVKFLTLTKVLYIHEHVTMLYGGEMGARDIRLLESALSMPQAGIGGEYFHDGVFAMAAAYLFHIVQNHPFVDGNKRTGLASAAAFLRLNGYKLTCSNELLTNMVLSVAEGATGKDEIGDFLEKNSMPIQ